MPEQRLIDANALLRDIERYHLSDGKFQHWVEIQSTIEPKKGKWERHNTYHGDDVSGFVDPDWRCSECGEQANVNAWCMYDLTDFCPNCGARMQEGEEHEPTMEEFMYGQDMGNPEDGSL